MNTRSDNMNDKSPRDFAPAHQPHNQLLTFPYHIFRDENCNKVLCDNIGTSDRRQTHFIRQLFSPSLLTMVKSSIFPRVYAAEKEEKPLSPKEDSEDENGEQTKYSQAIESLARVYILQETGWDRVKMLFEKDHRGKNDIELSYIEVALAQVFVITFFGKYIPAAKFARREFIRENQGTVFRTRFEALRRLQDHMTLKAGKEAGVFSVKMTVFSASFLFLSSMISSYRNKTSVLEYTLAAGLTGGLARLSLGLKGFIAGSVVGAFFGAGVGLLGYVSLSAYGMTQEERHLEAIKNKLDVLNSIEGESQFRNKISKILSQDKTTLPAPMS